MFTKLHQIVSIRRVQRGIGLDSDIITLKYFVCWAVGSECDISLFTFMHQSLANVA